MNTDQLRRRLQIHRRNCSEVPPVTESEQKVNQLHEYRYEAMIEAAQFRDAVHSAFRMCRLNTRNGTTQTLYEWESIKADFLNKIQEHEIEIINRIETQIHKQNECDKSRLPDLPRTEAPTQ